MKLRFTPGAAIRDELQQAEQRLPEHDRQRRDHDEEYVFARPEQMADHEHEEKFLSHSQDLHRAEKRN